MDALILLKIMPRVGGGKAGVPGKGGKGGSGGSGGRGGSSFSWTGILSFFFFFFIAYDLPILPPLSSINQLESHTSSYVDSNGVTHSHTSYTHHSNPGGCSGSNGIRGIKYIFCFSLFPLAIHSPFPSPFLLLHTSPPLPSPHLLVTITSFLSPFSSFPCPFILYFPCGVNKFINLFIMNIEY